MTIDRVVVEADGGSRGNPGPAGYGAVVRDPTDGQVLLTRHEYLGRATNNVAEYRGLIAGLEAALELGARAVDVRMDSKLVIEQTSGRWKVKHPDMQPLARRALDLLARFEDRTLQWIPRERNGDADRLANEAMDEGARGVATGPTSRATATPSTQPTPSTRSTATTDPVVVPASWRPASARATRLLLVRHGSTSHSPEHRMSGRNELSLSDDGRAQVAAVAGRLARELADVPDVVVVSSPVRRTRETAEVVAAALGVPVQVDDDLAELDFGAWEGLRPGELERRWPEEFRAWVGFGSDDARPPGGESIGELHARVRRARERIVAAHPGGTVVVVSHVTPIKSLVVAAIGAPTAAMMRMYLTPASVTEVRHHEDGSATLHSFNDRAHLEGRADH